MKSAAALLLAVLAAVPVVCDGESTFPYKHPELDRTPPTVPETADLGDGDGLESIAPWPQATRAD